jgi:hypothetical protein
LTIRYLSAESVSHTADEKCRLSRETYKGKRQATLGLTRRHRYVKEVCKTPMPAGGDPPIQLTILVKASNGPHSQGGWLWITRDLPNGKQSVFMGNFCERK